MKIALLGIVCTLIFSCSESTSPLQLDAKVFTPNVSVESDARTYLFDTLGAETVKIVFRNDETGNLAYAKLSKDSTILQEYDSDIDVYHPVISPDGKWVAFGTTPEPVGGRLFRVYLQRLDDSGLRIPVEGDAAIPRFRILPSGDTVLIYVSTSYINDDDSEWKSQATYESLFRNGRLSSPKKLFAGAYNGGVSEDLRLAVTGSHYLRVHSSLFGIEKDTVWYDSAQVCNVSLSTDGSLRTLFLDMASKRGQEFSKADYLPHHRILIADSLGNLIGSLPSPEPYSFDHPEWVYGSEHLISVMVTSDVHEKVFLLDVRDSSVHPIISGGDLWHPDIWIKK